MEGGDFIGFVSGSGVFDGCTPIRLILQGSHLAIRLGRCSASSKTVVKANPDTMYSYVTCGGFWW
jgi:hypothetical protein